VLGDHVEQRGSLVAPDRLRFDFAHSKPMAPDELAAVESMANAYVLQNSPVETRLMALEDARETGARALFGEKYGEEVRVVSMGSPEDASPARSDTKGKANKAWSVELCGGTHVARTGDIGLIRVTAESASASGVRRIEALTAQGAHDYLAQQDQRVRELAGALRTKPEDVVERVKALLEERRQMERELANAKRQLALSGSAAGNGAADQAQSAVRTVGKVKLMARSVQGLNPKDLRGLIDDGKKQVGSGIVAIVGVTEDGKAGLAVGVTEDLTATYNAVDLVKVGAAALGGKGGGGRPDMAQAGGPDGSKAQAALEAIEAQLAG
jgi:alanyl-tRNA synthetase